MRERQLDIQLGFHGERILADYTLPDSPTREINRALGLPTASIWDPIRLAILPDGPIAADFADASNVNIANECGLRTQVDLLMPFAKEALTKVFYDEPYIADAPGFDEFFILSPYGPKFSDRRVEDLSSLWNERRNAHFDMSYDRVRKAEVLALLREEMSSIYARFKLECKQYGLEPSLHGYRQFLGSNLGQTILELQRSSQEIEECGDLALKLALRQKGALADCILTGGLADHQRRVLGLTFGRVKFEGQLDPFTATQLFHHAENLSSRLKGGDASASGTHDFSEWIERRQHERARIEKILEVDAEYRGLLDRLIRGEIRQDRVYPAARRLLHMISSDRELGKGVVRMEKARDYPVELLLPEGQSLERDSQVFAATINLVGNGAFSKAFGFGAFDQMFREIGSVIKDITGAHFIIRNGGGNLIALMTPPPSGISLKDLQANLKTAIEKVPARILADEANAERTVNAAIGYGHRLALYKYKGELFKDEAVQRSPEFLSADVEVRLFTLMPGMPLRHFEDKLKAA